MTQQPQSDSTPDRRQALRYVLGMMAAVGAEPQMLDAWMQQVHAGHERASQPAGAHKKYQPLAEGKPSFFTPDEFQSLTRMVDLIIPRTDTPGAADAGVPLYIDIVVNSDHERGDKLRSGLSQLDSASRAASSKKFADATQAERIKVLQAMVSKQDPGNEFFESIKAMTIVGYYSSEIGLFAELHFIGNEALGNFPGCPHGGHKLDVVAKRQKVAAAVEDPLRKWPFPTSDNVTGEDL